MISIRFGLKGPWYAPNVAIFVGDVKAEDLKVLEDTVFKLKMFLPAKIGERLVLERR